MAAPLPAAADDRSSPAPEQQQPKQQQQSEQVPGPSAAPQAAQPEAAKSPVPLTPEELEQQAAAKLLEVRCPVCPWLGPAPPEEAKGWILLETQFDCAAMVVTCHCISASVVALSLHRLTCTLTWSAIARQFVITPARRCLPCAAPPAGGGGSAQGSAQDQGPHSRAGGAACGAGRKGGLLPLHSYTVRRWQVGQPASEAVAVWVGPTTASFTSCTLQRLPYSAGSSPSLPCAPQELVLLEKEQELLDKEQTLAILREEVRHIDRHWAFPCRLGLLLGRRAVELQGQLHSKGAHTRLMQLIACGAHLPAAHLRPSLLSHPHPLPRCSSWRVRRSCARC